MGARKEQEGPHVGKKPGLEEEPQLSAHHPSLTLTLVSLLSSLGLSFTVCSVRLTEQLNSGL